MSSCKWSGVGRWEGERTDSHVTPFIVYLFSLLTAGTGFLIWTFVELSYPSGGCLSVSGGPTVMALGMRNGRMALGMRNGRMALGMRNGRMGMRL